MFPGHDLRRLRSIRVVVASLGLGGILLAAILIGRGKFSGHTGNSRGTSGLRIVPDSGSPAIVPASSQRLERAPSADFQRMSAFPSLRSALEAVRLHLGGHELRELVGDDAFVAKLVDLERAIANNPEALMLLKALWETEGDELFRGLLLISTAGRQDCREWHVHQLRQASRPFIKLASVYGLLLKRLADAETSREALDRWKARLRSLSSDESAAVRGIEAGFSGGYKDFGFEQSLGIEPDPWNIPGLVEAWAGLLRSEKGLALGIWLSWLRVANHIPDALRPLVRDIAQSTVNPYVQVSAFVTIAEIGDDRDKAILVNMARDLASQWGTRLHASKALAACEHPDRFLILRELYRQAEGAERELVGDIKRDLQTALLLSPGSASGISLIHGYSLSPDSPQYGSVRDVLFEWLALERDAEIQYELADWILSRFRNTSDFITVLSTHSVPEVRLAVVDRIGAKDLEAYYPLVRRLARNDPSAKVRRSAQDLVTALEAEKD